MYHPGKVVAVLSAKDRNIVSADATVQATLRMWDDNVLTVIAAPGLATKMREGDIVLVDYRPEKGMSVPVPKNVIVKIIRGRPAERIWREYLEVHEKRRKRDTKEIQGQQSYIG